MDDNKAFVCSCKEMGIANTFRMLEYIRDEIERTAVDSKGFVINVKRYDKLVAIEKRLARDLAANYDIELPD